MLPVSVSLFTILLKMKRLRITVEGKTYEVEVELLDEQSGNNSSGDFESSASVPLGSSGTSGNVPDSISSNRESAAQNEDAGNVVVSPLSAVVVSIDVSVGDRVEEGQKVITLEAMKMNTVVSASIAGTVGKILVAEGNPVEEGQALIRMD